MTAATVLFDLEVDVAARRPPTPGNVRTHHVQMAVPDRPGFSRAENEARTLAALMGAVRGPMVTAVRIVSAEW